jgi:hypothetical protein
MKGWNLQWPDQIDNVFGKGRPLVCLFAFSKEENLKSITRHAQNNYQNRDCYGAVFPEPH